MQILQTANRLIKSTDSLIKSVGNLLLNDTNVFNPKASIVSEITKTSTSVTISFTSVRYGAEDIQYKIWNWDLGTTSVDWATYAFADGVSSKKISNLTAETQYSFVVQARSESGKISNYSNVLTVTTLASQNIVEGAYYVSKDAIDGNAAGSDSANGSIETPFATISHGVSVLRAGDTLYVREGTYHESFKMSKLCTGTADNRITIQAYPLDGDVIMDGSTPITGWAQCASDEAGLKVLGANHDDALSIYKATIPAAFYQDLDLGNVVPIATNRCPIMLLEDGVRCRIARVPTQNKTFGLDVRDPSFGNGTPTWADDMFVGVGSEATIQATASYVRDNDGFLDKDTGYWDGAWIDVWLLAANNNVERRTISSYTKVDGVLTANLDADLSGNISRQDGVRADGYSIVNHPGALTEAGEFYIDPTPHENPITHIMEYTIYYWPINVDNLASKMAYANLQTAFHFEEVPSNDYITIDGFIIKNYRLSGISVQSSSGVPKPTGDLRVGVTIQNCNISNIGDHPMNTHGVYFYNCNDVVVDNCTMENCKDRCITTKFVDGLIIRNCSLSKSWESNISCYPAQNVQIYNNTLYGSVGYHGHPMYVYADNIPLSYNVLVANNIMSTSDTCMPIYGVRGMFVFYGNVVISGSRSYATVTWADPVTGTHTGGTSSTTLTDANTAFEIDVYHTNSLVGRVVYNETSGAYALVTANTIHTITVASLSYGSRTTWLTGDSYSVGQHCTGDLIFLNNVILGNNSRGIAMSTTGTAVVANNAISGFTLTVSGEAVTHENNLYTLRYSNQVVEASGINATSTALTDIFTSPYSSGDYVITNTQYVPKAGSLLIAHGRSITEYLEEYNITTAFPDFDFTVDRNGRAWKVIPSIGAYEV